MKKIALVLTSVFMSFMTVGCSSTTTPSQQSQQASVQEENETVEQTTPDTQQSSVLIAYFSATNNTKAVAETLSTVIDADVFEIQASDPYTEDDLNYNDDSSRTTIEMNDDSIRPEIANTVENMDAYDIVFLGYPIWWSDAPRIISTFLESYDFSNKTIVPFCTSGGSGISTSVSSLQQLTQNSTWLEGERFSSNVSQDELSQWVQSLNLGL